MTLRDDLDTNCAVNRTPEAYRAGLDKLRDKYGHAIEIVDCGDIQRFNCFAFATGIVDLPAYQVLVDAESNSALLDSAFMRDLINDGDLQPVEDPAAGGIAVYFQGDRLTHAARILGDTSRFRSKWGPLEVHDHAHLEVPASYGDDVRFFAAPNSAAILKKLADAL